MWSVGNLNQDCKLNEKVRLRKSAEVGSLGISTRKLKFQRMSVVDGEEKKGVCVRSQKIRQKD